MKLCSEDQLPYGGSPSRDVSTIGALEVALGLVAMKANGWEGLLRGREPVDAYGRPYVVEQDGRITILQGLGRDACPNTEDDEHGIYFRSWADFVEWRDGVVGPYWFADGAVFGR
jgi:hypothetical protein